MNTQRMLAVGDKALLIIEERRNGAIVVGVPHHAPAGIHHLPCPQHHEADENAGFLGHALAERFNCHSVIACNYPVDVNKTLSTDYAVRIAHWRPKILIEIHGHGGTKTKHDVEISSGSAHHNNHSVSLAQALQRTKSLKRLSICGDFSQLRYTASTSVTITDNRWIAYHIELAPVFRLRPQGGRPPSLGYTFCDAMIEAIKCLHG